MMLFEVGDEVRVSQPTNLFHSELGKVVSIDHVKLTYKVVFHRGNSDVYTCFDLILVKRQEETSMKFKVGDKVKISNSWTGRDGEVGEIVSADCRCEFKYTITFDDGFEESFREEELESVKEEEKVMKFKVGDKVKVSNSWEGRSGEFGEITRRNVWGAYPWRVTFEDGIYESFKEEELELVKEEEKVMTFKVGDRVRMIRNTYGHRGKIGTLEKIDTSTMPYCVVFDDGRKEWCYGHEFKLLKEEKVMKFKVGDKVKVKDSWFGHDGQVGVVFRTDNCGPFNYSVKFNVEGDDGMRRENFKDDSLELAKQQFTKSDLKTGMGVVLRNGRKGHILVDTGCVDVIRFLENGNYSCLNDFSDNLTSNYREEHDIVEVYFTEYQFKLLTDQVFDQDCVFKREPEPTKMTMKEINEHFGKPIEIVE